jgi:GntR family transcriptional regulator, transcriptional repressor for pyruvate dehydrogenase complex
MPMAKDGQSLQRVPAIRKPAVVDRLGPIRTRRVFEEICERIRNQLISGELRPGDRLPPERELAEIYDVSRTAVHEALIILEIVGLLKLRKGRSGGAFISDHGSGLFTRSFRDMLDFGQASLAMLLEARAIIQVAVVQSACARATEQDFVLLQRNIDETSALTEAGLFEARTFKAIEFNVILANAAHNKVLATIVEAMSSVLRGFIASAGPQPHDPVIASRRELLARMRARDEAGAVECMRVYFDGLNKHLLRLKRAARHVAEKKPAGRPIRSLAQARGE